MNTLPIDLSVYMTPFVIILGVLARGLWLWLGLGLVDRGNPRNTPSRALLISIVYSLGLYALLASPLLLTLAPLLSVIYIRVLLDYYRLDLWRILRLHVFFGSVIFTYLCVSAFVLDPWEMRLVVPYVSAQVFAFPLDFPADGLGLKLTLLALSALFTYQFVVMGKPVKPWLETSLPLVEA